MFDYQRVTFFCWLLVNIPVRTFISFSGSQCLICLAPGFHELRQTPLTKEQEIKGALASEEGAEPSGGTEEHL
jgi:hypothetical protein